LDVTGVGAKIANNNPIILGKEKGKALEAQCAACVPVCRIRSLIAFTLPAN
jgi:hypothetical protein